MTQLQVASLFNGLGLAVILFLTGYVRMRYSNPVFKHWTGAYLGITGIWAAELLATFTGRTLLLDLGEFIVTAAASWYLFATAQAIEGHTPSRRQTGLLLAAPAAIAVAMRLAGVPFALSSTVPLLVYVAMYFWLGFVLLRYGKKHTGSRSWLLGLPVVGFGVQMLLYPVIQGTPFFWFGFTLSGLLQLLIGVGMVVFLLEESTRQLQEQHDRLLELDTLKSQILSTVGHELRTPLTSIKGFLELLDDQMLGPLEPEQHRCIGQALRNTEVLRELVESIMTSAHGATFTLKVAVRPMDLAASVRDAAESLMPQVREKNLALELALPEEGALALADPLRLTQVLLNLLGNAIKFSKAGTAIRVSVRRDQAMYRVVVVDQGVGIPAGQLTSIFDPFYQADSSNTRAFGGIGLGLAIAKNLVTAMGGTIHVESVHGKGSTFWFTLPAAHAAVASDPA